jgi:hypothetical protein
MPKDQLLKPNVQKRFCQLMLNACNYVDSIDDQRIPQDSDVVYCFAHHRPCRKAERIVLQRAKREHTCNVWTSLDWEETRTQQQPSRASTATIKDLENKARPSPELVFYPYAAFELTYNEKKGDFFHGQLCILLDEIPSQCDLNEWKPISLYRAPLGVDCFPALPTTKEELLAKGWVIIQVGREPEMKFNLGNNGLVGYREQYGLKHRIAITVHGIMGSTVSTLVTQIDRSVGLTLWEAAMVVVLLSRTRRASDIYFI